MYSSSLIISIVGSFFRDTANAASSSSTSDSHFLFSGYSRILSSASFMFFLTLSRIQWKKYSRKRKFIV